MSKELNEKLNTVLLAVVVSLSAWTLKEVADIGRHQAAMAVQIAHLERTVYKQE